MLKRNYSLMMMASEMGMSPAPISVISGAPPTNRTNANAEEISTMDALLLGRTRVSIYHAKRFLYYKQPIIIHPQH